MRSPHRGSLWQENLVTANNSCAALALEKPADRQASKLRNPSEKIKPRDSTRLVTRHRDLSQSEFPSKLLLGELKASAHLSNSYSDGWISNHG